MPLDRERIREHISTIEQVIQDLLYRDSMTVGELETFLDLLSPLVAELDRIRGDVLADLGELIEELRANQEDIDGLKEDIQDCKDELTGLDRNDPDYAVNEAQLQNEIRDCQEQIAALYPSPAPGRHIAPALFDTMAWTIITAQTLLYRFAGFLAQNRAAEEPAFRAAVQAPLGWARSYAGEAGAEEEDDTGVADADLHESLERMQGKVRALYTQRAYSRMTGSDLLADWQTRIGMEGGTFELLSLRNLNALRNDLNIGGLEDLSEDERRFVERFKALDWRVKHATSEEGRNSIAAAGVFLSKVGLYDWTPSPHLLESGYTFSIDELKKQDIDFFFFRVQQGEEVIDTRYGSVQINYPMGSILEQGWITLHDMLQPISSSQSDRLKVLRTHRARYGPQGTERLLLRRTFGEYTNAYSVNPPWWEHFFYDPRSPRTTRRVNIMDEIFCKRDVMDGMALTMLRDLKDVPTLKDEVFETLGDDAAFAAFMRDLVPRMFRIEAKYPSYFDYDTEGRVVQTNPN